MRMLLDERPLIVQPSLVKLLGSIERAVVLQQIHWLLQQPKTGDIDDDGVKWVWGSLQDWCDDYFQMWSPHTLRKHLNWLRDEGYIRAEKKTPDGWDKTNKYTVNYDAIERPDVDASKRPDVDASKRPDVDASKRPDVDASNKEQRLQQRLRQRERSADAQPVSAEPPPEINQPAWAEFEQHRKEIRKPLTDLARTKAWNQLKSLTPEQQQRVIDYSITGRYTGLYPEKAHEKHQQHRVSSARVSIGRDDLDW